MTSPDAQGYVDLSLYDSTPGVLVDRALLAATTRLPQWQPREGNTELVLLEALAVEVSELIYSVNRVPSAVLDGLLLLYGVERSLGTRPTATVTFTLTAPADYQLPAGTTVRLELGGEEEPLDFTTDAAVVVPTGSTSVTTAVTGSRATDVANNEPAGTALSMVTPIPYVDSVVLASAVIGGTGPEDDIAYRNRGAQRLARLVSTLVLPEHFTADALETVGVFRARTLDNFDAATSNEQQTVTITGGPTGGTFTLTFGGQTTAAITFDAAVTFVGRLGSQNVALMTVTSALTGGTSPAVTVTETRAGGGGTRAGYVSIAVLGTNGARLSAAAKADIQSRLDSRAQANLAVQVIDPGINAVDVTATVRALPGYTAADVTANVTAALDAFLSPDTWPWSATVRRNDLIALLETAEGVDYLLAGHPTVPAGDVTLTGAAPLADLGTVALTVQV
jgi:hypothetical protein